MQEYSIFKDTIADMTYPEVEQAVRDGAVALWALGVIEQHGPHLPLGTDVYVPMGRRRRAIVDHATRLMGPSNAFTFEPRTMTMTPSGFTTSSWS